jgi:hypothetical protein
MADSPAGLQSLIGNALRDTGELARKELALFKAEVAENMQGMLVGLSLLLVAAVFAIAALIWLTQALVNWLATILGSQALAALIVGGGLAVIAIGIGLFARSRLALVSLAPTRTMRSVKRDAEILSEKVTG